MVLKCHKAELKIIILKQPVLLQRAVTGNLATDVLGGSSSLCVGPSVSE